MRERGSEPLAPPFRSRNLSAGSGLTGYPQVGRPKKRAARANRRPKSWEETYCIVESTSDAGVGSLPLMTVRSGNGADTSRVLIGRPRLALGGASRLSRPPGTGGGISFWILQRNRACGRPRRPRAYVCNHESGPV